MLRRKHWDVAWCVITAFLIPDVAVAAKRADAYGNLPLRFERNQGQTAPEVRFLSRGPGYSLFLTGTGAVLQFGGKDNRAAVRMRMEGANPQSAVDGEGGLTGTVSYFTGNDPKQWRTGVSTFSRVRYREVYPGIDVVYYGNQGKLEYDFLVKPDADPGRITVVFDGAGPARIDEQGDLVLDTVGGEVRWKKPAVYQDADGERKQIAANYVLEKDGRVRFALARYDRSKPLVIDPVLAYATLAGGNNTESARGIAVDASGNAYVVGWTFSNDFPATFGTQQTSITSDVIIFKLNATGTAFLYTVFLSGNGLDEGYSVAVDAAGNAYVAGATESTNFPAVNAFQGQNRGVRDAFVAKLNAAGNALTYATYLGGAGTDAVNGISIDSTGNAYVAGETNSSDFPLLNPIQAALAGSSDAFVAKLNAAGSALMYSSYLGGSGTDRVIGASGIAVDNAGSAYVAGRTDSFNFPTVNPIQAANGNTGGTGNTVGDAFVTKINATGNALVYSTYLGGSFFEEAYSIRVDSSGNAYVAGRTDSFDFPVTAGAAQATYGGLTDAFVTKINAAGNAWSYSTFLGGLQLDEARAVAVDTSGNATAVGQTYSPNFPVASALQPVKANAVGLLMASTNGGTSWSQSANGLQSQGSLRVIAIDPLNPQVMYVSPNNTQVFKSTSGGGTWTLVSTPTANTINTIQIAPANTQTLYMGTAGGGVYVSTNGGVNWTQRNNGLDDLTVPHMVVHPTLVNTAYAATGSGVFKTTDGGATWTAINNGITNLTVNALAINRVDPQTLYAATNATGAGGMFKTTDGGATWTLSAAGMGNSNTLAVVIAPSNPNHVYANVNGRIYRSGNAGGIWNQANNVFSGFIQGGVPSAPLLAVDPTNPAIVYVGTSDSGVWRTTDSGATWNPMNNGLNDANIFSLAMHPSSGSILYAGTDLERDAFVTKLNSTGTGFVYSTHLGGPGNDIAYAVAASGPDVYLAGDAGTGSSTGITSSFPITPGVVRRMPRGTEAFVAKITEATPACTYSALTDQDLFYSGNFSGYIHVTAPSGCAWAAVSSDPTWLRVTSGTGAGVGRVGFRLDSNPTNVTRTANITVQGTPIAITQVAGNCSYALSSASSPTIPAAGGTGSVTVAMSNATGCPWFAVNVPNWVTIDSIVTPFGGQATHTGNGSVNYTVASNPSILPRSNTMALGGQNYTINQDGTCSYTVTPASVQLPSGSGSSTLAIVTAGSNCTWQVTGLPTWITITSGASGTGSGTGFYNYQSNTSADPRSVTLTIGNRSVTVIQAGTACTFTLNISSQLFTASGGNFSAGFTASDSSCPWNLLATPPPSWITLTGLTSGDGDGTLAGAVAANPTVNFRTGTISVGNKVFTIEQQGTAANNAPTAPSSTPNSGTGSAQTFSLVYSDADGSQQIAWTQVLFAATTSPVGACNVHLDRFGGALWLLNDAGTVWQGPAVIGSPTNLSNSQCTVDAQLTTFSPGATSVTWELAVTFSASFAGFKNIFMRTQDINGASVGPVDRGDWNIPGNVGPTVVSVTPGTGTGGGGTFNFAFSDVNGQTNINSAQMLINTSFTAAGGCMVYYDRVGNQLYLANNAGAFALPAITPGSGSASNSQCTLNGSGSSISTSGITRTVNLSLTFTPPFTGMKNIYMQATDGTALTSSGQNTVRGTFSVTVAPVAVSVAPATGRGVGQTFSFVVSDPNGGSTLTNLFQVLINGSFTTFQGCFIHLDPLANQVYLADNLGNFTNAAITLGQAGSTANSYCSIDAATSSQAASGNNRTLNLNISFTPSFAGVKNIWLRGQDNTGQLTGPAGGWQLRGVYTVTDSPSAGSVTISSGLGVNVVFTGTYTDPNGVTGGLGTGALSWAEMLVAVDENASDGKFCYVFYDRTGNSFWFLGNAFFLGPFTPGQVPASTPTNQSCSFNPQLSSVTTSGNTLTLSLAMTFTQPTFSGMRKIFLRAGDLPPTSQNSGWQQRGVWIVP